jgi:hypothetical protein
MMTPRWLGCLLIFAPPRVIENIAGGIDRAAEDFEHKMANVR